MNHIDSFKFLLSQRYKPCMLWVTLEHPSSHPKITLRSPVGEGVGEAMEIARGFGGEGPNAHERESRVASEGLANFNSTMEKVVQESDDFMTISRATRQTKACRLAATRRARNSRQVRWICGDLQLVGVSLSSCIRARKLRCSLPVLFVGLLVRRTMFALTIRTSHQHNYILFLFQFDGRGRHVMVISTTLLDVIILWGSRCELLCSIQV